MISDGKGTGNGDEDIFEEVKRLRINGEMPEIVYMNRYTFVSLLYESLMSNNVVSTIKNGMFEHYIWGLKMEEDNDLADNQIVIK